MTDASLVPRAPRVLTSREFDTALALGPSVGQGIVFCRERSILVSLKAGVPISTLSARTEIRSHFTKTNISNLEVSLVERTVNDRHGVDLKKERQEKWLCF